MYDYHYNLIVEIYERTTDESGGELNKDRYDAELYCVVCEVHVESNMTKNKQERLE